MMRGGNVFTPVCESVHRGLFPLYSEAPYSGGRALYSRGLHTVTPPPLDCVLEDGNATVSTSLAVKQEDCLVAARNISTTEILVPI